MNHGCAALAHRLPPAARVEPVEHDQRSAHGHHRGGRDGHGIHMKGRQRCQHPLTVAAQTDVATRLGIPVTGMQIVFVGQDTALGPSRRSRGVEEAHSVELSGQASTWGQD